MTNPKVGMLAGLIDRSGSMSGVKKETIQGINILLREQARLVKHGYLETIYCYLAQFDFSPFTAHSDKSGGYEVLVDMDTLDWASLPDLSDYYPRGMTALYDSLAHLIDEVGKRLSDMSEAERPGKVIIFINTDGVDNASIEYTVDALKAMIKHQEDVYSWEFLFMSSDLNSVTQAVNLGINSSTHYNSDDTVEACRMSSKSMSRSFTGN